MGYGLRGYGLHDTAAHVGSMGRRREINLYEEWYSHNTAAGDVGYLGTNWYLKDESGQQRRETDTLARRESWGVSGNMNRMFA